MLKQVRRKPTLHDVSKQNGEMICNFATENNMTVLNSNTKQSIKEPGFHLN